MSGAVWRAPAWSGETRRVPGRPVRESRGEPRPPEAVRTLSAGQDAAAPVAGPNSQTAHAGQPEACREDDRGAQAQAAARALEAELEALRRQATREGHEAGLAQGQAEARARFQADLDRLQSLADHIESQVDEALSNAEGLVFELVLAGCRQILGEAAVGGDAVGHVVARAMEAARRDKAVSVRVHADDLAWLGRSGAAAPRGIPWVADAEVMRGGCVVCFEGGTLDARIERQFRLLARALADGWSDAHA